MPTQSPERDPASPAGIFALSQHLLADYADYVSSFLNIADERIRAFVEEELLQKGTLWPEALLQLGPAFQPAVTVAELCRRGRLDPRCADIFHDHARNQPLRLYRHQLDAVERALKHEPYVVTSGTGSGKTLAYFIPIFDAILRNNPQEQKVRAIIVYPMNALVNSQYQALLKLAEGYRKRTGQELPVRFACYTGQDSPETKQYLQHNPPHILLTNYMMLELMLVRPDEKPFVDRTATGLEYLVFDELHTYRGRQGADVALLIRRLREQCRRPDLLCIGTSATMVAGKGIDAAQRRQVVADFAGKIFGVPFKPENVIEETLQPLAAAGEVAAEPLRAAVQGPLPQAATEMQASPLTAWIERTFGLVEEPGGNLRRRTPISVQAGAQRLAEITGLDETSCADKLRQMFLRGTQLKTSEGNPLFAFKLHHFISQGRSVYATLEASEQRYLTLEGQYYAPGQEKRVLYPLLFCRVCGQEYYAVLRDEQNDCLLPMESDADAAQTGAVSGYAVLARPGAEPEWEPEHLPSEWLDPNGRPKRNYRPYVPEALWPQPDGTYTDEPTEGRQQIWFQPKPFMLCLKCGEFYTGRDKNDFRKLARLSSEGRSTATTVLSSSALLHASQGGITEKAQKLLSFTDNRQDASLQAGHFNDFVQVSLLRAAIYAALEQQGELRYDNIAQRVWEMTQLEVKDVARSPEIDPESAAARDVLNIFRNLLEYRIYEDLRRGWRVVQPNLEQCGLLRIGYRDLDILCAQDAKWASLAPMAPIPSGQRREIVQTLLDHFRRKLAVNAPVFEEEYQRQLQRRVRQTLNDTWGLEENELPRPAERFLLSGPGNRQITGLSLSRGSLVGRYLCRKLGLTAETYGPFVEQLVDLLRQQGLVTRGVERGTEYVQLEAAALVWKLGDGTPPPIDPIYSRQAQSGLYVETQRQANRFFSTFYRDTARRLRGVEGREHTAQVNVEDRQLREKRFSAGELKVLFCSPTMELGVDIQDLQLVHMRNVPPTPANYAQRSGRAGRGNDPATVLTYCAAQSGHDQYFFKNRDQLVAGAVRAPRLDLSNQDLLEAHLHALWLGKVGLPLGGSIADLVEMENADYPLSANVQAQVRLSPDRLAECRREAEHILQSCGADLAEGGWYSAEWLENVLRTASESFDRAFDVWRELYKAALAQMKEAQLALQRPGDRETQERARRRETEAIRQRNLLCNIGVTREESDFYPYRYLASQGFLPGYNFPRLPVRAFVQRGQGEFIARPRDLALSEFGPQNIIYHEGAKYQVGALVAPPGGLESHRKEAKLCKVCGYFIAQASDDTCDHCHTRLDGRTSEVVRLLEMPNVRTWRRERITCDEEERSRLGYQLSTHFRFMPTPGGQPQVIEAVVKGAAGTPLLKLVYGAAAQLYHINHGWKSQQRNPGFGLNFTTGEWMNAPGAEAEVPPTPAANAPAIETVRLFVAETQNILLCYMLQPDLRADLARVVTLQYALQRGIENTFQVEEAEIASGLIGQDEHLSIMFWEAAEGGVGVLRRLVDEPEALRQVARAALERLHFAPDTLEDTNAVDCPQACYECLLSYSNQRDHARLNRHLVADLLAQLQQGVAELQTDGRTYDEHYHWLRQMTDARSDLERRFLDYLYAQKLRLPDDAQKQLGDYPAIPDFFYAPNMCVFCDGSVHDAPEQKAKDQRVRADLSDRGYRVVVIRYDESMAERLRGFADVFGSSVNVP